MNQRNSSLQPPTESPTESSRTTENPVVAVGRKFKAALTSSQHSSVRIRGDSSTSTSIGASRRTERDDALPDPNASVLHFANTQTQSRAGTFLRSWFGGRGESHIADRPLENEYSSDTVDLLDVVDPEVATLSTLTNVQNSLFVPSLGKFLNRRPTYRLSTPYRDVRTLDKLKASLKHITRLVEEGDEKGAESRLKRLREPLVRAHKHFKKEKPREFQFAVLPDDETLPGWTHKEKEEMDDLVRHMLHSRRARFRRSMRGFGQYVRRPLGLFITVYATLITLFGAAWVLFLIGWISVGSKKDYVVHVVDSVLVALFAIMGYGLAPFRAVDTYHMIYIARYHRKTHKRRENFGLPDLVDQNDLPEQRKEEAEAGQVDIESLVARRMPRRLAQMVTPRIPERFAQKMVARSRRNDPLSEYTVLTEEEQAKLEYHERKFSKSHTFYKPHETETHYAFPLKFLVTVVLLLDCHSLLQIALGACTWGIPYKTRPFAITTVILCCSITCNITAGVLISRGDKKTRKNDVIDRMMRQELTFDAIHEMETRWIKEAEERGEIDKSVREKLQQEREEEENEEIKKAWKVVPLLPKTLLGKGVDHRQPSLPQEARRSNPSVAAGTGSSTSGKSKSKSNAALPALPEEAGLPRSQSALPSRPQPAHKRDKEPKEPTARKALRQIRRADLDRS